MNTVSVIGPGRWGTFLAWYLATQKNIDITLYGLEDSPQYQELKNTKKNSFLEIPNNITLTSNLDEALKSQYIIISINSQGLKELAETLDKYNIEGKTFILAMKGMYIPTHQRLSQVMKENIHQKINVAVLLGPGHVQDYTKGIPNCAVIDSDDEIVKDNVINLMKSHLMRLYYGVDLIGNEVGGAYKNVIGIAAGMLDGLGWNSLKGALMSRSIAEVGRFIEKCGGNPRSASGLAFLGDFEATLFSKHSNNRLYGEMFVSGGSVGDKNCEGYYTLQAVYEMGKEFDIELPITNALYNIVYNKYPIKEEINKLFNRDTKKEFNF